MPFGPLIWQILTKRAPLPVVHLSLKSRCCPKLSPLNTAIGLIRLESLLHEFLIFAIYFSGHKGKAFQDVNDNRVLADTWEGLGVSCSLALQCLLSMQEMLGLDPLRENILCSLCPSEETINRGPNTLYSHEPHRD